jgi:hypothetical protein
MQKPSKMSLGEYYTRSAGAVIGSLLTGMLYRYVMQRLGK